MVVVLLALLMFPGEGRIPATKVAATIAKSLFSDWGGWRTSLAVRGEATFYGRGVMEEVYANRLALGDLVPCGDCVGLVAMPLRSDVGRRVMIRFAGVVYGPFLVVDCAAPRDLGLMAARRRVVEVSWEQAAAWGMVGPVEVELMPSANGGSGAADSRAAWGLRTVEPHLGGY